MSYKIKLEFMDNKTYENIFEDYHFENNMLVLKKDDTETRYLNTQVLMDMIVKKVQD